MHRLLLSFCAWACLTGAGSAQAQLRAEIERCRAIPEAVARLACYDAISVSSAPAVASKYESVELAELKAFALSYRGRLVEVRGFLARGPHRYWLLQTGAQDADPLFVEARQLGRREQQMLDETCAAGCAARVQGRVGPVNFETGLVADTIVPE